MYRWQQVHGVDPAGRDTANNTRAGDGVAGSVAAFPAMTGD
jgi:hypothetical protein